MARPRGGRFSAYEVPRQHSQTVLDVVTHIQRHLEPSLSYRFACRVGMCGSCAMTVNGKARWTCRTHVAKVLDEGQRPRDCAACQPAGDQGSRHRHGRVLRQVGARPGPVQGHGDASRRLRAGRTELRRSAWRPTPASNASAARFAIPSCDIVAWRPDFLGPAALNRAWTLVNDVRDDRNSPTACARSPAMPAATRATRRAPAPSAAPSSSPTLAIAGLKRTVAKAAVRGEL